MKILGAFIGSTLLIIMLGGVSYLPFAMLANFAGITLNIIKGA